MGTRSNRAGALTGAFMACLGVNAAAAQDGAYVIDASHSHVQFSVDRFGFNSVIGAFRDVSGSVALNEKDPAKSAVTARIVVSSLQSGDATRDEHVTGARWLDAAAYPEIRFTSTKVELVDEDEAKVTGDLTLHGVTKPATLHVKLNKFGSDPATKKKAAGFSASAEVKRSDFGLTAAQGLVGDVVTIRIEALTHAAQ